MDIAKRVLLALLATLACAGTLAGGAQADIYWVNSNTDTIGRSGNNGTGANANWLASPDTVGNGIAVDATYVYWTGWSGQIWRALRDGTGTTEIVSDATNPTALAVDDQYLYFTNANFESLGRVPKTGGPAQNDFITTGVQPDSVAVTATHIYWTNFNDGTIGRANIDGTNVDNEFITGLTDPRGIMTDGTYLYWSQFSAFSIGRANLDGTGVNTTWFDIGYRPYGLAMTGGAVYWAEPIDGYIGLKVPWTTTEGYITDAAGMPTGLAATGAGWRQPTESGALGNANTNIGVNGPTRTFTVTNAGPYGGGVDPLTFTAGAVTLTGTNANQFSKTADTCSGTTVQPHASCTVTVRFQPTSTGAKSASLRFADNAVTSPQTVALTGRGTAPTFSAAPNPLALGSVAVGDTGTAQTVTVTNTPTQGVNAGTLTIPGGGVTLVGTNPDQFSITDDQCSGQTLAPSGTCTVSVAFAPTSAGAKTASLRFADNAAGNPHSVTVNGTGVDPAPVAGGRPGITGIPQPGQTLNAGTGTWTGGTPTGYAYSWKRCNANGSVCTDVGTNSSQYPLTGDDAGFRMRVAVTASNSGGSATQRSGLTDTVGLPVGTSKPVIGGVPQPGQTFTATTGGWDGSPTGYAYEWQRCDQLGEACTPVGTDSAQYVLDNADIGTRMRVKVTASNAAGSAPMRSDPSPLVGRPVAGARPEITGTPQPGSQLAASTGDWSAGGTPSSFSYTWRRCDDTGDVCSVVGADSAFYDLTGADIGFRMRVTVTASNAAGSTPSRSGLTARVGLPIPAGRPTITGVAREGETLSATTGSWEGGAADSYVYEWRRCAAVGAESCVAVGTDSSQYLLAPEDVGYRIRVAVTAVNSAGSALQRSDPTKIVAAPLAR